MSLAAALERSAGLPCGPCGGVHLPAGDVDALETALRDWLKDLRPYLDGAQPGPVGEGERAERWAGAYDWSRQHHLIWPCVCTACCAWADAWVDDEIRRITADIAERERRAEAAGHRLALERQRREEEARNRPAPPAEPPAPPPEAVQALQEAGPSTDYAPERLPEPPAPLQPASEPPAAVAPVAQKHCGLCGDLRTTSCGWSRCPVTPKLRQRSY